MMAPTSRYRIRRVAPGAFVRHGAIAGLLVALLPGIAIGVLTGYLVRTARLTLEGWRAVRIPLPAGLSATVDFVELLRLAPLFQTLRGWDAAAWLVPSTVVLGALVAGALLGAVVSLVLVLLLNLASRAGGGLTVELERMPDA
jgi:uncharacterized membrane protein